MSYIVRKSLESSIRMIKKYSKLPHLCRSFASSKILASNYEGDGKTTVQILNKEYKHLIMVDTFSSMGFRLSNGIFVIGPMATFPRTVLQWDVNDVGDITPESLSLFSLLEPKLDILIIGTGDKRALLDKKALEYLKSNGIAPEILPTYGALSIFNFLNAEGRYIAGAFIPPTYVVQYQEEMQLLDTVEAIDDYSVPADTKIYK